MKLTNGTHTFEVKSPTEINNLKAQGYRPVEEEKSSSSRRPRSGSNDSGGGDNQ